MDVLALLAHTLNEEARGEEAVRLYFEHDGGWVGVMFVGAVMRVSPPPIPSHPSLIQGMPDNIGIGMYDDVVRRGTRSLLRKQKGDTRDQVVVFVLTPTP